MGDDDAWIRQLAGVRSQSGAEKRAEAGGEAPARRCAGVERGDDKTAGKIVRAGSSAVSKLHLMLLNITQLPEAWTPQDRHSRERFYGLCQVGRTLGGMNSCPFLNRAKAVRRILRARMTCTAEEGRALARREVKYVRQECVR